MPVSRIWELLAKKYNNEISKEELRELELFLTEHQDRFQLNEVISALHEIPLQKITDPSDEQRSLEAIKLAVAQSRQPEYELTEEQPKRKSGAPGMVRRISLLAGAVLVAIFIWLQRAEKQPGGNEKGIAMNEIVTNNSSKSTIRLPDGSTVKLNSNSKLQYNKDFGIGAREISLVGEAFFDIAKNEALPLTVHAGNVNIKVKGTVFNVKAYEDDSKVEAALIEGAIEVFEKSDPERKILLRPNEKIMIGKTPAAQEDIKQVKKTGTAKEGIWELGRIKPNPTDSSINEIAWIEDQLVFHKEPFFSLAQKMERWYNVSIQFETEKMRDMTFTGSFEKENIVEALDALQQLTRFNYKIENKAVIISAEK